MTNKYVKILNKARSILINQGWTQEWFAKDAFGKNTSYNSPDASCFCARGAILRATQDYVLIFDFEPRIKTEAICESFFLGLTKDSNGNDVSLARFNDVAGRKLEEVLEVFDLAIAKAEKVSK